MKMSPMVKPGLWTTRLFNFFVLCVLMRSTYNTTVVPGPLIFRKLAVLSVAQQCTKRRHCVFLFQFLSSMPRMNDNKVFVISCMEDRSVCKKPLEAGIPVVSAEIVLTGILRQELDFEEYPFCFPNAVDTES